jgi:hypothetical protein
MWTNFAGLGLIAALTVAAVAMSAQAKDDDATYQSGIIGSARAMTIGGVNSANEAWKVAKGKVTLESNGRLKIEIFGLVLIANDTTGGIPEVVASLVCGGSGGSIVATSVQAGLSVAGNAEIRDDLTLPATCPAPVVLVQIFRPASTPQLGPFIALSGISG